MNYFFASMVLKKEVIKNVYTSNDFSYILFRWKKHDSVNQYIIWGIPYNSKGQEVPGVNYIYPDLDPAGPPVTLPTESLGVLVLSKDVMTAKQMTGDADAYFTPLAYSSGGKQFVQYEISSRVIDLLKIITFALNPSPPR